MIKSINKSFKVCALCKNWNGARGSDTIVAKPGGFYEIDNSEEKICSMTGFKKGAMSKCPKFENRY